MKVKSDDIIRIIAIVGMVGVFLLSGWLMGNT